MGERADVRIENETNMRSKMTRHGQRRLLEQLKT